jgi:hypothetical protein
MFYFTNTKNRRVKMIKFRSVKRDNIVYVVTDKDNSSYYRSPSSYISPEVSEYDTLGDGDIQHTPEYLVSSINFKDWLISFSKHVLENNLSEDEEKCIRFLIYGDDKKEIKFLEKLQYKEDKLTFFNLKELKISRAESKRYDKRWEKIPSWFVPNAEEIFTLLNQEKPISGILKRFNRWIEIKDALEYYVSQGEGAKFFKTTEDEYSERLLAMYLFKNTIQFVNYKQLAKKQLERELKR